MMPEEMFHEIVSDDNNLNIFFSFMVVFSQVLSKLIQKSVVNQAGLNSFHIC